MDRTRTLNISKYGLARSDGDSSEDSTPALSTPDDLVNMVVLSLFIVRL